MSNKYNFSRRNFLIGGASLTAIGIGSTALGCSNVQKQNDKIDEIKNKIKLDRFEINFTAIDSHTEGEFCRIIIDGFPTPQGSSVMEKKNFMEKNHDNLRTALMLEPRGHQNMFGAFLCEPSDKKAVTGVIFMDAGGYLNMCGHCSIGAVTVLLETGIIEMKEGENNVAIEAPSGLIETVAIVKNSKVESVTIQNVPAFVYKENLTANIDGLEIPYDICFGGSFFAMVDSEKIGIKLLDKSVSKEITDIGMHLRKKINETVKVQHPILDINTVDLVEFYGPTPNKDKADLRSAVVFGGSQIDRSPCGTGTSAKLALLHKRGKINIGQDFRYESILGSVFIGKIKETTKVAEYDAVIPLITGSNYITGYGHYLIDPTDPLKYGFNLNEEE